MGRSGRDRREEEAGIIRRSGIRIVLIIVPRNERRRFRAHL